MKLTEKEIQNAARESEDYLINAVGDCGDTYGMSVVERDIHADNQYEDEGTVEGLLGDHIYDHAHGDDQDFILICQAIIKNTYHEVTKKVCSKMIKEHERRIQCLKWD